MAGVNKAKKKAPKKKAGRGRGGRRLRLRDLAFPLLLTAVSVCLVVYPYFANWLNDRQTKSSASVYEATVEDTDDDTMDLLYKEAQAYNEALVASHVTLTDPFTNDTVSTDGTVFDYWNILAVDDTGVMCYLEIPKINLYITVYHGTSTEVLYNGAGHLAGSSAPVGGVSTHAVISAHTGTSNAKLFTDLENMEEGDYFFIHVLDETLAYQVDQIKVVEPNDTSDLGIVYGEDYVTLLTCTPYGINSHRLLVRGTRVEYTPEVEEEAEDQAANSTATSRWMLEYVRAMAAGLGLVNAVSYLVFFLMLRRRWRIVQQDGMKVWESAEKEVAKQRKKREKQERKYGKEEDERLMDEDSDRGDDDNDGGGGKVGKLITEIISARA